ncbi:MAG: hypothetical protein N3A01_08105 [Bacteroidales bacterium]|nr:hypothetical protein [Bacteroidales bacterium]
MKRLVLMLAIFSGVIKLNAQEDTTIIKLGKDLKILIVKPKASDTIKEVVISGDIATGKDTTTTKKKKKMFKGHFSGIEFGVNGFMYNYEFNLPVQYSLLDLNYNYSKNFNLNIIEESINLCNNKLGIVTGLGLNYKNFRFKNNVNIYDTSHTLTYVLDTINKYSVNKLTIFSISVPLLLEINIPVGKKTDKFYLNAGVGGELKVKSHTRQTFSGDHRTIKEKRNYYLLPLQANFQLRFGFNDFGLYFNYYPFYLFQKNKGPEFNVWSAGIGLYF